MKIAQEYAFQIMNVMEILTAINHSAEKKIQVVLVGRRKRNPPAAKIKIAQENAFQTRNVMILNAINHSAEEKIQVVLVG